jgi:serine/threonine protein kinase
MSGNFGDYEILSEVGRGGMGIVYKARRRSDGEIVAIKQLVLSNVGKEKIQEFRDRFKREAATAQRLKHPNIVTVFDVEIDADNYFYVMEFLEGNSLRRHLEINGGRISVLEFSRILTQVVEGLSFAHTMNVVHRDVKPDNIFILDNGTVKVTDFGIARVADFEDAHLTKTGVMMGTLAYVSPEQLQDAKNVDHRADIFSLGVVTYEALSGTVPFSGEGIAQTIVKIVSQEEKPLHMLNPGVGVGISGCVAKSLRKKARDRYRSVNEFGRDFAQAMAENDGGIYGGDNLQKLDVTQSLTLPALDNRLYTTTDPGRALTEVAPEISSTPQRHHAANDGDYMAEIKQPKLIISKSGKSEALFVEPMAASYNSGKLIVADGASRLVHFFNADGRWLSDLSCPPEKMDSATGGGRATKPSGIVTDGKGRIYLSDSSDSFVRVFDSRGLFQREICNLQAKDGGINGLAIDSTGILYISDATNGCIQVFQPELGLWMRKIGSKGNAEGQMQLPAGMAIDRLNQLYVTDYGTSRILVFNKAGAMLRSFGSKGNKPGQFNLPRSIAIDKNDKIYVLDSLNHRVQIFSAKGDLFGVFGARGNLPGQFLGPSDLTIDAVNDLLYVVDKGNKRVQVFDICLR